MGSLASPISGIVSIPKICWHIGDDETDFCDRDELGASGDLNESIVNALSDSENLIVVCSKNAARSHWVDAEVKQYQKLGRQDHIFCLFLDGAQNDVENECLPVSLRGGREPLGADVRPESDGKRLAMLKLVAATAGIDLAKLRDRDAWRRNRRLPQITAASVADMVLTLGLAITAYNAEIEARQQTEMAARPGKFSTRVLNELHGN